MFKDKASVHIIIIKAFTGKYVIKTNKTTEKN